MPIPVPVPPLVPYVGPGGLAFAYSTPPTLANWQFNFGGLTFGHGTQYAVAGVQGLGDMPAVRSGDVPKPRDHGEIAGLDLLGGRDIVIDLEVHATGTGSGQLVQDQLLALGLATSPGFATEQPLWFQIADYPLFGVMARPRKRVQTWDIGYQIGKVAQVAIGFHCTDPRIYSVAQQSVMSLGGSSTSGYTFPGTFPAIFGGGTTGGSTVVANTGNIETRPLLVLSGPLTAPQILNASITGTPYIKVINPSSPSLTVASGDQLVIDLSTHSLLYYTGGVLSGSTPAPVGSWLASGSTWWNLPPGFNTIQFLAGTYSSGTCAVQWASAYQL